MSKSHFLLCSLLLSVKILFGSCQNNDATNFVVVIPNELFQTRNESFCLHSIHVKKDAIDPGTNLLSGKYRTKSTSMIVATNTTNGSCESIKQMNNTFYYSSNFNEFNRVQLRTKGKSVVRAHDVFTPYPSSCYGENYIHTVFNNLTRLLVVFNPGGVPANVFLTKANKQSWLYSQMTGKPTSFEINDTLNLILAPDEFLFLRPSEQAEGKWIKVTATKPIGFLLGVGRPVNKNPTLELLPSRAFFGMDYIIVHATAVKYHEVTITLLPVRVDKTTKIQIMSLQERGNTTTVSTSSFYEIKNVSESKRITADNPIQVFRTSQNTHPDSPDNMFTMTIIPPTDRWQWTAVVYPLLSVEGSEKENKQVVTVLLKKEDILGFQVVHLETGKDVKGRLMFESLPKTDFSFAIVNLSPTDKWYMQQIHRKLFLVMQYGQYRTYGSYAFSATSDVCGRYRKGDLRSVKASGGADKLGVDQAKVFLGLVAMFLATMMV